MAIQLTPTTSIIVDSTPFQVDQMSETIRNLVMHYDDWRTRQINAASEASMAHTAVLSIQQQIEAQVAKEQQEQAQANADGESWDKAEDADVKPAKTKKESTSKE